MCPPACHSEPIGEESRFEHFILGFEILRFAQDDKYKSKFMHKKCTPKKIRCARLDIFFLTCGVLRLQQLCRGGVHIDFNIVMKLQNRRGTTRRDLPVNHRFHRVGFRTAGGDQHNLFRLHN